MTKNLKTTKQPKSGSAKKTTKAAPKPRKLTPDERINALEAAINQSFGISDQRHAAVVRRHRQLENTVNLMLRILGESDHITESAVREAMGVEVERVINFRKAVNAEVKAAAEEKRDQKPLEGVKSTLEIVWDLMDAAATEKQNEMRDFDQKAAETMKAADASLGPAALPPETA